MNGIRSLISPQAKIINNKAVAKNCQIYANTKDTFERTTAMKDIARSFRTQVVVPFSDWESVLPANKKEGSTLLRDTLTPYIEAIKNFSKKDAEVFSKLVFGENQVKQLEKSSKKNTDIRVLKQTLEEAMGKSLSDVIIKK